MSLCGGSVFFRIHEGESLDATGKRNTPESSSTLALLLKMSKSEYKDESTSGKNNGSSKFKRA